ncbi:MBL fold metallo-hydrolase [Bacillus sp. FSL W7-1360]
MRTINVSPHVKKVEAWFLVKVSAWIVKGTEGVYLVDTGLSFMAKRLLREIEKWGELKAVLLTHGHFDHVGGLKKILAAHTVPVYAHVSEMKYLEGSEPYPGMKKATHAVPSHLAETLPVLPDGMFKEIGGLTPFYTPGHTPGHVAYYHEADNVLIGGDLFMSRGGQLRKPFGSATVDLKQAVTSGRVVETLKPRLVSLCHGRDVYEPHKQIDAYVARYQGS